MSFSEEPSQLHRRGGGNNYYNQNNYAVNNLSEKQYKRVSKFWADVTHKHKWTKMDTSCMLISPTSHTHQEYCDTVFKYLLHQC